MLEGEGQREGARQARMGGAHDEACVWMRVAGMWLRLSRR